MILAFFLCMYTDGQTYHQPTTNQQTAGFKSYQITIPPYNQTDLPIRPENTELNIQWQRISTGHFINSYNTRKLTPRGNTQGVDPKNTTNRPHTHRRYKKEEKKKTIASVHNGINTRHPQTTDGVFSFWGMDNIRRPYKGN